MPLLSPSGGGLLPAEMGVASVVSWATSSYGGVEGGGVGGGEGVSEWTDGKESSSN